jgi:F-type H+-transporting ATPase subunit b
MESMLSAVGEIVLNALPTLFLLILLHFYLKRVLFQPLEKAVDARRAATEGIRKLAAESLEYAEKKAAEYEEALRHTRNELYKEQETARQAWRARQAEAIAEMRKKSEAMVREARAEISAEAVAARDALRTESECLAEQIVASLLRRRAN